MKVSYNWLKKFVDFDLSPRELASLLTSVGIEAFVVVNGRFWTNVITVRVLDICKHPNADKLSLCKVSDGIKEYLIVCGAKNIAVDQIVALAKVGAILPGDFKIKKSKIRGIESEGIICSQKELGLECDSEGILVLDKGTKIGNPLEEVLDKLDSVIEIEVATNRGDCLSHLGVAREIGAKLRKIVSLPEIKTLNIPMLNCVEVKSNLCLRYIGSTISNVKIGPSPKWIVEALQKNGIKAINNIVDITNYIMIEMGQPLHAFDMAKLSSKQVVVRNAFDLEKIIALDDKKYELDSETLIIADVQKPIAIAGIMGGKYTSIDEDTSTIFLESAVFNAESVRRTSKRLNLSSDASYRFERGVDYKMAEFAMSRAISLIVDIAGGKVEAKEDLQNIKYENSKIILRVERVTKILGYTIEKNEIAEILRHLGIDLQPMGEILLCTIPSWRNDLKVEVDLIEEIARIKGYDSIMLSLKEKKSVNKMYCPNSSFLSAIVEEFRSKLKGLGFSEALNCSFSEIKELNKFDLKYYYKISNPISKENEVLRPSLLPCLYKNLMLNIKKGAETITLFEHGKIFNELGERKTFAIIAYGKVWPEWWMWAEQKIEPRYDFYFGGGIIKNILPSDEFIIDKNAIPKYYYHSGKNASVVYKGKIVGQFGILRPSITENVKGEVFYFEINLDLVDEFYVCKTPFYKMYSKFPVVKRDISIIADKTLKFSKIEKVIESIMKSGGVLKEYSLFSVYTDENKVGKNNIGYSFRLSYQNNVRTLTDEEVNKDMNVLLDKFNSDLGVKLREKSNNGVS
ncbi:MAG: phenylalanine--tRNA ligase subunit beta [Endomicrobium sp.]|jgi:phenylalanyl-tRNA synthetase beta chain|nr:phenylalanine--tRNA ligase subunit beta [Endomicrobium sp.]